ncbi:MAG: endonuclease/exonuclease/phosphatase family protein [Fidelibacterota bacterium]
MGKRVVWVLLLVIFTGCSQNQSQNVMSFNIRFDSAQDGINRWTNRKEMVRNLFYEKNIDIAGLQEVLPNQFKYLSENLQEYDIYGVGRDDGQQAGEYCPILYRKARFELLESNTFWLSETPEKPGNLCWNTVCNRICSWVKVKDRKSRETWYFFNTHLSHVSNPAREKSVELLLSKIDKIAGDSKFILTGDFNFQMDSKAYQKLIGNDNLILHNSADLAQYNYREGDHTYNGWGQGNYRPIIDYIFVSENFHAEEYSILMKKEGKVFISDHYPVIAKIHK